MQAVEVPYYYNCDHGIQTWNMYWPFWGILIIRQENSLASRVWELRQVAELTGWAITADGEGHLPRDNI